MKRKRWFRAVESARGRSVVARMRAVLARSPEWATLDPPEQARKLPTRVPVTKSVRGPAARSGLRLLGLRRRTDSATEPCRRRLIRGNH